MPRTTGLYRSPEFCEHAGRLADVQERYLRTCIDLLTDAGMLAHDDTDPLVAAAKDKAALLAALSARSDRASMIADTRRTLTMPLKCEFGETPGGFPQFGWRHF